MADAYAMLSIFKPTLGGNNQQRRANQAASTPPSAITDDGSMSGTTFAQTANTVAGNDGRIHDGITCFKCEKIGHYAGNCPTPAPPTSTGTQHVQIGVDLHGFGDKNTAYGTTFATIAADKTTIIPQTWILLDSQSTVSVFCNRHLLRNI